MPTYEYVCTKCRHQFEIFQSMKDKPLAFCPQALCPQKKWGKGKVKKRISLGGGLLFKGSGFYTTDYRSEGYKSAAKKDTAPAAPASAPATTPSSSPPSAAASAGGNGSQPSSGTSRGGTTPAKK
jgi:putative FmdB family regulatory protein